MINETASALITIAIPTYNRAGTYLPIALESARNQTYENIEIIVADNCSGDHTAELVQGLADPRIRYFRHEINIGANPNFNFCLEKAKGSYFQLLQDDDLIDPDFIGKCIDAAAEKKGETGIIRTGARLIDGEGRAEAEVPNIVTGPEMEDLFRDWFENRTALYLCSTLFNTRRLRELGGFNSSKNLFQDVAAQFRLAAAFGRVDVPQVKASFRKHPAELTFAARVRDWCEDSVELIELIDQLSGAGKKEIMKKARYFFSRVNYNRALKIASPGGRLPAMFSVYRRFGFTCPPPVHALLPLDGQFAKKLFGIKKKVFHALRF